jgi:hypothetical protein
MIQNICGINGYLPLLQRLWVGCAFNNPGLTPGAIFFASFRGIKMKAG